MKLQRTHPGATLVSMRSSFSMDVPENFRGEQSSHTKMKPRKTHSSEAILVSAKSSFLMDAAEHSREQSSHTKMKPKRPHSPEATQVSVKSSFSMDVPENFKGEQSSHTKMKPRRPHSPEATQVSVKSSFSMDVPENFKGEQSSHTKVTLETTKVSSHHQINTKLGDVFGRLEDSIAAFVKHELERFQRLLCSHHCQHPESQDEEVLDHDSEQQRSTDRNALLTITLSYLRRMGEKEVADALQKEMFASDCQRIMKSRLRRESHFVFEGIVKAGNPAPLNQIYTELYINEEWTVEVSDQHEIRQIETSFKKKSRPEKNIRLEDIFKVKDPVRTVLTKGVAGIGKTVLIQKLTLDWAEDKANQDIHFLFPFSFRELNLLKDKKFSVVELIYYFFPETRDAGISSFEEFNVVFILDGLDECRLSLNFYNNMILTDVTESTSVDVLLTNLIRGKLLPSARLWITTRPAAANQIPSEYVDMVTEVRGFTDGQKEEYFKKRFSNKKQASTIISHIKKSQSLHTMCHIPVFCWITATVLEDMWKSREGGMLPKTLTEMYIHFLVVQAKVKNIKYDGGARSDPHWSSDSRRMIKSLGKLAFEQLLKGNLIFYESDLTESDIDVRDASVCSGVFTQIFKEERGLYQSKVFCFVHLSFQEFLAALHVHLTFSNSGVNLLAEETTGSMLSKLFGNKSELFYQSAVDKALQSPNGHLDLFLRFLLGLSLPNNQSLLRGLMTDGGSQTQPDQNIDLIKKKLEDDLCPERSINLFHCLSELNDHSLVEEIQQHLRSGCLSTYRLSPAQWSALVFTLLSADDELDVFDLSKYSASEEALLRLLPVVKASKKAVINGCDLSEGSCEPLSSVLSCPSSNLRDLDLSNNDLRDSGVKLLCDGLSSPNCALETLRLSGCLLTGEGCSHLTKALRSETSHLRELDLSYNNMGDSPTESLSAILNDPHCRLDTLRVDHGGPQMMRPGLRKYFLQLRLDPKTANKRLKLCDEDRKARLVQQEQTYSDDPERFDYWNQVLCTSGLTGRAYWEVKWRGAVYIGVTYRGIKRRGEGDDCCLGRNDLSWSLGLTDEDYTTSHSDRRASIPPPPSGRVGVYLDWEGGILSLFTVSSNTLTPLRTFHTTFSEPVYPAFGMRIKPCDASIALCQI